MNTKLLYLSRTKVQLIYASAPLYYTNDDTFCEIAVKIDDLYRQINILQSKRARFSFHHKIYDPNEY